jgi:hypothetical protein
LQDLFAVILSCDKNLDNRISDEDLNRFVVRVKDFFGRQGKSLDEEALREAFKNSMTKSNISLFRITTGLLEGEEQKIDPPAEQEMVQMLRKVTSSCAPQQSTEPEVIDLVHVRSTGLVVPNIESLKSEGHAPNNFHDARVEKLAGVQSLEDTLLDGLLNSSSKDYAAASTSDCGSIDAEGFLGFIQSFSGDWKAPEPQKEVVMNNV